MNTVPAKGPPIVYKHANPRNSLSSNAKTPSLSSRRLNNLDRKYFLTPVLTLNMSIANSPYPTTLFMLICSNLWKTPIKLLLVPREPGTLQTCLTSPQSYLLSNTPAMRTWSVGLVTVRISPESTVMSSSSAGTI
jgi:hypothetical protein